MRDLVGHDRRPASFLVYLWLTVEAQHVRGRVQVSYQEMAETIGVSKSSAQAAVACDGAKEAAGGRKGDGDGNADV